MGLRLFENVLTTVAYKRPLLLFGGPGVTLFLIGMTIGSLSFWNIDMFNTWLFQLLVAGSLMLVGIIMVMFGLMQNSLAMLLRMNSVESNSANHLALPLSSEAVDMPWYWHKTVWMSGSNVRQCSFFGISTLIDA